MPVGAGIAAAGIGGGLISASAAKSAAKTQAAAANQAADTQLQMFSTIRGDLAPYRSFGATALPGLARLLGLSGTGTGQGSTTYNGITVPAAVGTPDWGKYLTDNPDVMQYGATHLQDYGDVNGDGQLDLTDFAQGHYNRFGRSEGRALSMIAPPAATTTTTANADGTTTNPIQAELESLPGYQFARDQGVASVNRALGSKGLTGAQAKGISRFVTGLADQTYGEQVNRLMNVANLGAGAATQTGNFGTQAASGAANAQIGAGTAAASGTVGAANALGGALSSIPQALLYNRVLGGGGGSAGLYGTALANSGNMYTGSYGGGSVPY